MQIKVLGCSGAIAKDCRTTSFLVGDHILIDAGTGVGDLALAQMKLIDHVFLTHAHMDHIAALPLMIDACGAQRSKPLHVHALAATIEALKKHIFNDLIWPDFTVLPSTDHPWVILEPLETGQAFSIGDVQIEALSAVHTVPAVGYAVTKQGQSWVFSGDTERNPQFWQRVNELDVCYLVIETAFSDREKELAKLSLHLSPQTLAQELDCIPTDRHYPIYITHTKPSETTLIMEQIQRFDGTDLRGTHIRHDVRKLNVGQEFNL
jgi:ribonuclease BN (tRNA processing enzyme)